MGDAGAGVDPGANAAGLLDVPADRVLELAAVPVVQLTEARLHAPRPEDLEDLTDVGEVAAGSTSQPSEVSTSGTSMSADRTA